MVAYLFSYIITISKKIAIFAQRKLYGSDRTSVEFPIGTDFGDGGKCRRIGKLSPFPRASRSERRRSVYYPISGVVPLAWIALGYD